MEILDGTIGWEDLATLAGATVLGPLIAALTEALKLAFPPLDARLSGATIAFLLTLGVYVAGVAALGLANVDLMYLVGFVNTVTVAIGVNSAAKHAIAARSGAAGPGGGGD